MDKSKRAVAIKYEPGMQAPKVIAKGKGIVAQNLIDEVKDKNIPVYEDKELVEELTKIDIGDSIPPELYQVVAKVLLFISDLDKLESYRLYGK